MMRHTTEAVMAVMLLATGAILITTPLRWRSSRAALERARAIAMAEPAPAAAGSEPRQVRPGRSGRRGRRVVRDLLEGSAWADVAAAAAAASAAAGQAWPYAMLMSPQDITVLLAGPSPPEFPAPWQKARRGWNIGRRYLAAAASAPAHPSGPFVTLGSCDGCAVLLDLACAPAVIALTGDPDAARALLRSLVMQLQAVPSNRMLVTPGFMPGMPQAGPAQLLGRLGREADSRDDAGVAWTFFVCGGAVPAALDRLRRHAASDDRLRIIVLGEIGGSRLSLQVSADGGVIAEGLGLAAASRPAVDLAAPGRPRPGRTSAGAASPGGTLRGTARVALPAASAEESWPDDDDPPRPGDDHDPAWPGDDDPTWPAYDPVLGSHPALGPVPERDPRLEPPQAPENR